MLLECEGDACAAALKAPKAGSGVLLEEFTVEELPKPENPEDPKLLVGSEESLNEKEAAEGADGLPKAGGWETLVEDIAPNAGGLQPAEELPKAGAFPDEAPKRLELVLKEKLLALVLLLFTGKPAITNAFRMGTPAILKHCYFNPAEENSKKVGS